MHTESVSGIWSTASRPRRSLALSRYVRLCFVATLIAFGLSGRAQGDSPREGDETWTALLGLAADVVGEGGVLDQEGLQAKLDMIVDIHAAFYRDVMGRPVSSQRVLATKRGFSFFLKVVQAEYKGDTRKSVLRVVKELTANRDLFQTLLLSDHSPEVVEEVLLSHLARNQTLSYAEPVRIDAQLRYQPGDHPLQIVGDGVRLVADIGTAGHYNNAIDAGETIHLIVPLKNDTTDAFRSTSGFLRSSDPYVRIEKSEVLYTERRVVGGDTTTFAPGMTIIPTQHYSFTVLRDCPDKHPIEFELLAWDSDRGKFTVPFQLVAYNVGPLDFGNARIDDDVPGPSNGNGDGRADPKETIEYVLALQNRGAVAVDDISAQLFSSNPTLQFQSGADQLNYKRVDPNAQRPIPASFVFSLQPDDPSRKPQFEVRLRLLATGQCRGLKYSWLNAALLPIAISEARWNRLVESNSQGVLSCDFSNDQFGGWRSGPNYTLRDGWYTIDASKKEGGLLWVHRECEFDKERDFFISVLARRADGTPGGFGMLWGCDKELGSFYSFRVLDDGSASYGAVLKGKWRQGSLRMRPKSTGDEVFWIEMRKLGSRTEFRIDGELVGTAPAEPWFGDRVGFIVSHGSVVQFDDLTIRSFGPN